MDQKLFYLVNQQWAGPWLDLPMVLLSSFDFWIPFFGLLIGWYLVRGGFHGRMFVISVGIAVGLTDGLVCNPLKKIVDRPRPRQAEAVRVVDFAKRKPRFLAIAEPLVVKTSKPEKPPIEGRSFPSSHTANCFAVATVSFLFFRRWGGLVYLLALGVGVSRLYVGAHWPSDVLASSVLGCATGALAVWLTGAVWRRWGGRYLPRVHARHPRMLSAPVPETRTEPILS